MDNCCATTRPCRTTPGLEVRHCPDCGTLWGTHTRLPDGRAWDETYVPEHFAQALRMRRELQANTLVDLLASVIGGGNVLDYGTGQGVFLAAALAKGVDAYGCDLDTNAPLSAAPKDRVIQLDGPWAMPKGSWWSVVMLDVLEHHEDPVQFLAKLDCKFLLIKVPNATGPAARLARLAAMMGRAGLLEQLFLVGENFPHRWLATKRGLRSIATRAGYEVIAERALVEVGAELSDRMRGESGFLKRCVLKIAGITLGVLGTFWSDASVIILKRK